MTIYTKKELNKALETAKDVLCFFGNIKTIDEDKQAFFKNGAEALKIAQNFINQSLKKQTEKLNL